MIATRETTQPEREETLLLLASLERGRFFMQPEPWHVRALVELQAEGPDRRAM